MINQDEYKVELEVFEGPLDLLLYLIKRDEIDIYNIPIERVTSQYMEYLNLMRLLDLNIAGEFIVMAATLMMIKSRMLLPVDERPDLEEEEEDPRWELVRQLVEYKKFKDAALQLQEREIDQENVFRVGSDGVVVEAEAGITLGDLSIFDLIAAFNGVLKRAGTESPGEVVGERFSVADKIEVLLELIREGGRLVFSQLFDRAASRDEVVCTFMALLELIRLRQVRARQKSRFGEIVISGVEA